MLAVDKAWSKAEMSGDAAFVSRLLAPGYISARADGSATTREAIIARTRARHADPMARTQIEAWRAAHPSHGDVKLLGDSAVLTQVGMQHRTPIFSSDIFVYNQGHLQAIYSQHSAALR